MTLRRENILLKSAKRVKGEGEGCVNVCDLWSGNRWSCVEEPGFSRCDSCLSPALATDLHFRMQLAGHRPVKGEKEPQQLGQPWWQAGIMKKSWDWRCGGLCIRPGGFIGNVLHG